ncbi:hypothetical protein, partial [Streptomyces flavofungini]|uniref:hypothetical protein n=1 Tax=Streptomyces flavofungini TaxID=68200 RepID=UPI0034DF1134
MSQEPGSRRSGGRPAIALLTAVCLIAVCLVTVCLIAVSGDGDGDGDHKTGDRDRRARDAPGLPISRLVRVAAD